jgi:hypothetical protein
MGLDVQEWVMRAETVQSLIQAIAWKKIQIHGRPRGRKVRWLDSPVQVKGRCSEAPQDDDRTAWKRVGEADRENAIVIQVGELLIGGGWCQEVIDVKTSGDPLGRFGKLTGNAVRKGHTNLRRWCLPRVHPLGK